MKIRFTFLLLFLLQFPLNRLGAKSIQSDNPGLPLKQDRSVLFGKDIVIKDIPTEDQRNVTVCSAFNGWLYACYLRLDETGHGYSYFLLRSTYNGINWTEIYMVYNDSSNEIITKMDLVACGDSISNIKVFW